MLSKKIFLSLCLALLSLLAIIPIAAAEYSSSCLNFMQAVNDLPLGGTFTKPDYLLSNGTDIADEYWFYNGNLGQTKIDVRVRKSDVTIRKVELTTTSAENFFGDMIPTINNLYQKPNTKNTAPSEQKYIWEYNSYKVTFVSKLNTNFQYDISFVAEWK